MAQMRFTKGDFRGALTDDLDKMAMAATAAMTETATAAKLAGRASIASAGFSQRWQNSLQANVYPSTGKSLSPAAVVFDKIRYSEIFQTGGVISGDPLWLPIERNLPGSPIKWTPKRYAQSVGKLVSVNIPGRPPLLFDAKRRVPVFVGISQVTLSKKFNVDEAVASEAAKLPGRYAAKLKAL
jgi:hypothetical protein